jgi:hypothetical protein
MDPAVEQYYRLFAFWATAASPAIREGAWRGLIQFLIENPAVYTKLAGRVLTQQVIVEVEKGLLRALAAKGVQRGMQATMLPAMRLYLVRLGANFAVSPKIPIPQAQLALTIAIALGTFAPAFAESKRSAEKYPRYVEYVATYMARIAKVVEMKPGVAQRLSQPQTFEEWLIENP